MECFAADFFQFCNTAVKVFFLSDRLSTCPSISSISGVSLKFSNFPRSLVLIPLATREATCIFRF